MKQQDQIELCFSRDPHVGSTAGVQLVKAPGSKLGLMLDEDAVVKRVAAWTFSDIRFRS